MSEQKSSNNSRAPAPFAWIAGSVREARPESDGKPLAAKLAENQERFDALGAQSVVGRVVMGTGVAAFFASVMMGAIGNASPDLAAIGSVGQASLIGSLAAVFVGAVTAEWARSRRADTLSQAANAVSDTMLMKLATDPRGVSEKSRWIDGAQNARDNAQEPRFSRLVANLALRDLAGANESAPMNRKLEIDFSQGSFGARRAARAAASIIDSLDTGVSPARPASRFGNPAA